MKVKSGSFLEVFNYKDLLNQLVSRDIKLKYRRSFLGYVWSILNPLLIMIVMVIVFSKMFNRSIPHFPVYLFAGRILYEFVIGACGKALGSITDNSSLLKKTYVSKFMFPLAKSQAHLLTACFHWERFLSLSYSHVHHFIGRCCCSRSYSFRPIYLPADWAFFLHSSMYSSEIQDIYGMRSPQRGCTVQRYSIL